METVECQVGLKRPLYKVYKERVTCFLRGLAFVGVGVCAAANNLTNQIVCLYHRALKKRNDPDPKFVSEFSEWVSNNLLRLYRRHAHVVPTPWESWNARFPSKTRFENQKAHEKVESGQVTAADFRRNSFFVKIETQWKWFLSTIIGLFSEEWAPRCIINASIYVRVVLGPWMHSFAKSLKRCWSVTRSALAFESGYTSLQVGEWLRTWTANIRDGEYLEVDYSRWDSSITTEMLQIAEKVYTFFGLHGFWLWVYRLQYKLKATSALGLFFSRLGMVASGVPNTTVGNSILNGMLTAFILEKAGGKLGRDYAVMVRGDDMIAVVRRGLCLEFSKQTERLGLTPKMKRGHPVEKVTFCSNAFYPAIHNGHNVWVAAPTLRAMLKIAWTTSVVPFIFWRSHARGVALGLYDLTYHIPIFRAYLETVLRLCPASLDSRSRSYEARPIEQSKIKYIAPTRCEASPDVNRFLCRRYDLSVGVLDGSKRTIEACDEMCFIGSPSIQLLVESVSREA